MSGRHKISTTVSATTFAYLKSMIGSGKARSMAEALDLSVRGLRRVENRARLAANTAAYFASVPAEVAEEERRMETALDSIAGEVNFDAG